MPVAMPVTVPVVPTVATDVLLLLQLPPGVPSLSEAVAPTQMLTGVAGVMAAGVALTVRVVEALQVPIA